MSLLVLDQVTLFFGSRLIFGDVNLRLIEGDRVGLVGPNGSGKTTMMKIIAGKQEIDDGQVIRARGMKLGWLPQELVIEGGVSLREFMIAGVPGRKELEESYESSLADLGKAAEEGDDAAMEDASQRVSDLLERIEHFERDYGEHQALAILSGLGFKPGDEERDLDEFSGGWKMRAVLGALLFQKPDVLLLDEPTNHLDMPSVAWFSDFLKKYRGAFILISHDREFLNEQIKRVVSLEPEGVRSYQGDYESYRKQRAEESLVLEARAKNIEKEREHLQSFVNRFKAKASKATQAQSRVKALEKLETVEVHERRAVMGFTFQPTERTVTDVVKIDNISKAYGSNVVFPNLSLLVRRGEKIGMIGANGAGKTTLLKMIAGEMPPDGGTIAIGNGVKVGYYAQHHAELLDMSSTVLDVAKRVNPLIPEPRVRAILGAFMFSGDDVKKYVRVLSGGERARVALARLLINPGTLILMDEPTNHLDLESAESLTTSLQTFDGTLLFVSHSKRLVRALATKIWNVENQTVENYPGTFDDYLYTLSERRRMGEKVVSHNLGVGESRSTAGAVVARPKTPTSDDRNNRGDDKERKRREAEERKRKNQVLGPLQKAVEKAEADVMALEAQKAQLIADMANPDIIADSKKMAVVTVSFGKVEKDLAAATEVWEQAAMKLEEASSAS